MKIKRNANLGIISCVSDSLKPINEDCGRSFKGEFNAIAIADGVGSLAYAKEASEEITQNVIELLMMVDEESLDLCKIFRETQKKLHQKICIEQPNAPEKSFASTLIIAVEKADKFIVGYTGNGAILHARGNISDFPKEIYYLPWACTNYLNPHTEPYEGREALNKHFAYKSDLKFVEPTIIEISKDNIHFGDLLIVCTDGIHSMDHVDIAMDDNSKIWIEGKKSLHILGNDLRDFLSGNDLDENNLKLCLQNYLQKLKEIPEEMSDDCTVGIIISKKAVDYQLSKKIDGFD